MTRKALILSGALVFAGLSTAHADDAAAPSDQLTSPKGAVTIDAFFELNLSKSAVGKPISLSPDLWYGATDNLTLGLVHSSVGATGFLGGVGDALCLSGESNGCAHLYQGVGLDARYRLKAPFNVDGGLYIRNFDPVRDRLGQAHGGFQAAARSGRAGDEGSSGDHEGPGGWSH